MGTRRIALGDMELSTCAAEHYDRRCGILFLEPEPVKKVATGVASAQVVIRKHQRGPRIKVALGWIVGLKIRHGRTKTVALIERERGPGERDSFLHQKTVSC